MKNDIIEILTELRKVNAHISVKGDNLKLDIPKGLLTDSLKNKIKENKQGLIDFLSNRNGDDVIPSAADSPNYPMSFAQKRLWMLSQLSEDNNRSFNMSGYRELGEGVNEKAFILAFEAIVKRHEILRTVYEPNGGDPRQRIVPFDECGFRVEQFDYSGQEMGSPKVIRLMDSMRRELFDLAKGPLIRAGLIKLAKGNYVFYYCKHHY